MYTHTRTLKHTINITVEKCMIYEYISDICKYTVIINNVYTLITLYYICLTVLAETRRKSGEFVQHLTLIEGNLLKRKSKGGIGSLGYVKRHFVLNNISLLYSKNSDDKKSEVWTLYF